MNDETARTNVRVLHAEAERLGRPKSGVSSRVTSITWTGPAGLEGFILPKDASDETRRLNTEKVVTIAWTPEFEKAGNYGGHLDNVSAEFIHHVAPLITGGEVPASPPPATPAK